ncbi:unnamed protein product, partial [Pylaiella littoralis]
LLHEEGASILGTDIHFSLLGNGNYIQGTRVPPAHSSRVSRVLLPSGSVASSAHCTFGYSRRFFATDAQDVPSRPWGSPGLPLESGARAGVPGDGSSSTPVPGVPSVSAGASSSASVGAAASSSAGPILTGEAGGARVSGGGSGGGGDG